MIWVQQSLIYVNKTLTSLEQNTQYVRKEPKVQPLPKAAKVGDAFNGSIVFAQLMARFATIDRLQSSL